MGDPVHRLHARGSSLSAQPRVLILVADSFGVGDVWILRYRGNELDDGQGFTSDPERCKAQLDRFVDYEGVENQDVVIWYAAHFPELNTSGEMVLVGPDLKPTNW